LDLNEEEEEEMSRVDQRQKDLQEVTSKIIRQSHVDPKSVSR